MSADYPDLSGPDGVADGSPWWEDAPSYCDLCGEEIDPATWSSALPLGFIERGNQERSRVWLVTGRTVGKALPARVAAGR